MAQISLRKLNKIYKGGSHAVRDLSLEIGDGDFTVLVGPSGCGKSTLLRMIAGLEEISFGELYIDGVLANELPPKDRGIAMVFQNYALFPHMTVFDNIAFGLKINRLPKAEIKQRVNEAAEILGVTTLLTRKPAQLSGGQKQRVALGRALVNKPRIFLLDEPLSNLDAKLRSSMRSELIKLHRKLNTTFIYVTHDQTEALTMGTKIAVLKDGVLQQAASPRTVYSYPANLFTATFIGSPQMNIFAAELDGESATRVKIGGNTVALPVGIVDRLVDGYPGRAVNIGVRPEHMHICVDGDISAVVQTYEPLGCTGIVGLDIDGNAANLYADGKRPYAEGETVKLTIDTEHIRIFDADSGVSLLAAPQYNYFRAAASVVDGKLEIDFAGTSAALDRYDCLIDDGVIDNGGYFGVGGSPTDDGDVEIEISINCVSRKFDCDTVYAVTRGGEQLVFDCRCGSEYEAGQKCTVKFDSGNCMLFDENKNKALSAFPSRGKMCKPYVKGENARGRSLAILADEKFNDGWLLYCGDDDNYVVVKVPPDYPVYGKTKITVEAIADRSAGE